MSGEVRCNADTPTYHDRCSDDEGVYIVGCQMPEDNYAIRNYVDSLLGQ